MSKRYWFYVCGTGSLKSHGEHRVCFSASDNEASLIALLRSAFCVNTPAFKLYAMLDEAGDLMHYAEVRAANDDVPVCEEGGEDAPRTAKAVHLAFVSTNTVLNDLLAYCQAVTQPAEQPNPPPALYLLVDCEANGAHTPYLLVLVALKVHACADRVAQWCTPPGVHVLVVCDANGAHTPA